MKKILLSAVACLSMICSTNAQEIQPCGTYQAREIYLKSVPGYAEKLNAAESASEAEYKAFLKNLASSKTSSLSVRSFTIPVVFHILHQGENVGTGTNIPDDQLIEAIEQVNRDFAALGSDTTQIDPLFRSSYQNSKITFALAKKDGNGNCSNGIVRHKDLNTNWSQSNLDNYQYSTMGAGNWNPSKYLNVYIVKNIISRSSVVGGGIIVGYTHLPGTSPISAADAIIYRYDYLNGLQARALSHEIGHWLGLAHTFGSTNNPGFECGDDGILDTPPTTGFFATCPKPANFLDSPILTNPIDSSDVLKVSFGSMSNTTSLNSLSGIFIKPLSTLTGTTVNSPQKTETLTVTANGTSGGYADFSNVYGNDFNANTSQKLSITSLAKSTESNYVAAYIDYNRDGDFLDANETILASTGGSLGTQTYTKTVSIPSGIYGIVRMRIINSNQAITGPTMSIASGEIEDYNLNIGTTPSGANPNLTMASCSSIRPNFENIMDYSSCPKMFTEGQIDKMRMSLQSSIGSRDSLVGVANLKFTGLIDNNGNPTPASSCAPIADFAYNKASICAGQAVIFNSISYNSIPSSYLWTFEGGSPSTSTLATQTVTYSTPGTYSVSLTVFNSDGSNSKVVQSLVRTNWNGVKTLPYQEDFESGVWWPEGLVVVNADLGTNTWEQSNYGSNSSKSIVLANANYFSSARNANNIDIFELPTLDFSTTSNVSISFDYSFARKPSVVADTFKLQFSTDCGGTWKNVLGTPTASQMAASGGTVSAPYIPWSSTTPNPKWVTKTISSALLNELNNKRDVKLRFWFKNDATTGTSQNLYLDNINISGTVGLSELEKEIGLAIYPNPTNSSAVIDFTPSSNSQVSIVVTDITGRIIEENQVKVFGGVNTNYSINKSSNLNSGIYFVTLTIDNQKLTKKLIIE